MTLQEIKQAIADGKTVHWSNGAYTVIKDSKGQYLIKHSAGSCVGLTRADDVTLNGKEEEFFIYMTDEEKRKIIAELEVISHDKEKENPIYIREFTHINKSGRGAIGFNIPFENLFKEDDKKICDCCGEYMTKGYVLDGGEQYFCSDECLFHEHGNNAHNDLNIGEDDSDSYWTEWDLKVDDKETTLNEFLENSFVGDKWEIASDIYIRTK